MNPKELRIGNFIHMKLGLDLEVVSIDKSKIGIKIIGNDNVFDTYESHIANGIPLNHDWLSELGFIWCESLKYYFLGYGQNKKEFIIIEGNGCFGVCDMDFNPEIKHVHQLQNAFYVLTGEELIKRNVIV